MWGINGWLVGGRNRIYQFSCDSIYILNIIKFYSLGGMKTKEWDLRSIRRKEVDKKDLGFVVVM